MWAATWQNQQCECAPSENSDQPGRPPSLIRVFAVRMKQAWVLRYPLSAQRRLWSDWADAQADLSLRWAHSHFVGFVMSWLNCIDEKYSTLSGTDAPCYVQTNIWYHKYRETTVITYRITKMQLLFKKLWTIRTYGKKSFEEVFLLKEFNLSPNKTIRERRARRVYRQSSCNA